MTEGKYSKCYCVMFYQFSNLNLKLSYTGIVKAITTRRTHDVIKYTSGL